MKKIFIFPSVFQIHRAPPPQKWLEKESDFQKRYSSRVEQNASDGAILSSMRNSSRECWLECQLSSSARHRFVKSERRMPTVYCRRKANLKTVQRASLDDSRSVEAAIARDRVGKTKKRKRPIVSIPDLVFIICSL